MKRTKYITIETLLNCGDFCHKMRDIKMLHLFNQSLAEFIGLNWSYALVTLKHLPDGERYYAELDLWVAMKSDLMDQIKGNQFWRWLFLRDTASMKSLIPLKVVSLGS